ncbi:hypothetical protein GIX45_21540 [Erwinia sp. CPCC 100877]|nr:hypothetical protein [Erwinia sp. CPCC 100877]
MMMLPRFYARLCARRADRSLTGERIGQNYCHFMGCTPDRIPQGFLRQTIYEQSGFGFIEQIMPPTAWPKTLRGDLRQKMAAFCEHSSLFSQRRTLLLTLQWAGLGLMLEALIAAAPPGIRFRFITRHPVLLKLRDAFPARRPTSLFAADDCQITLLLVDERLPEAPLFPAMAGKQRLWLTDVPAAPLIRRGYDIRNLVPERSLHDPNFGLRSRRYPAADYRLAATETLESVRNTPALWSAWDDLSVLYHG